MLLLLIEDIFKGLSNICSNRFANTLPYLSGAINPFRASPYLTIDVSGTKLDNGI